MLPLNLSDTAVTSQDGSSLELIAATCTWLSFKSCCKRSNICLEVNASDQQLSPSSLAWSSFVNQLSLSSRAGRPIGVSISG